MSTNRPGTIYIIGELDHTGEPTDLYKIGLVNDNDSRSVEERLLEHQTANPRELRVVHAEPTPIVERVETLLHGEFASHRVGGEWFHLPDALISRAVEATIEHASEARLAHDDLHRATELNLIESNGCHIDPTAEDLRLHIDVCTANAELKQVRQAQKNLTEQMLACQQNGSAERQWVRLEHKAGVVTFDRVAFARRHPRINASYMTPKTSLTRRFTISPAGDTQENTVRDADLSALLDTSRAMTGSPTDGGTLHRLYLELIAHEAQLQWEADRLSNRLRAACGEHDGITSVCTWRRRETVTEVLDTARLKRERPALHRMFVQVREPVTAAVPSRDLGYRLPANSQVTAMDRENEPMGARS